MFPAGTRVEDMQVCEAHEIKLFCKDYVEKAEIMFILATTASFLIILSLVNFYFLFLFGEPYATYIFVNLLKIGYP